jgi:TonB family protein
VVGKDDPLFQAAVQKRLDEELKKQDARAAKQQDSAAKKKQADIEQVSEETRKARDTEDAARAARDRADREEAARLAREGAAKRREEAQAAAAPAAPAVKEGDLVEIEACDTPPVATRQVSPAVPAMARQRRVSGTVLLRVLVDETGKPEKVEILRDVTPNVGLGASSAQALEQWRWRPATKNGVKVKTWMAVQVPFKS